LRCRHPDPVCNPKDSPQFTCSDGYDKSSLMCSRCLSGFYADGDLCLRCPSTAIFIATNVSGLLILLVWFLWPTQQADKQAERVDEWSAELVQQPREI